MLGRLKSDRTWFHDVAPPRSPRGLRANEDDDAVRFIRHARVQDVSRFGWAGGAGRMPRRSDLAPDLPGPTIRDRLVTRARTSWTGHLQAIADPLRALGHDPVTLQVGIGAKTALPASPSSPLSLVGRPPKRCLIVLVSSARIAVTETSGVRSQS